MESTRRDDDEKGECRQLSPLAGFRPKCLRVSALQPFGKEAGLGAPSPEIPYKDPRASCPHWRVSGPNALGPRLCSRSGERPLEALSLRMPPTVEREAV